MRPSTSSSPALRVWRVWSLFPTIHRLAAIRYPAATLGTQTRFVQFFLITKNKFSNLIQIIYHGL